MVNGYDVIMFTCKISNKFAQFTHKVNKITAAP